MKLIIENIGIIEKADIELEGLTVIAGNNDTGKSTVGKIAYSLTKSFEDFELNYEKKRSKAIEKYFREFFIIFRKDVDLRRNNELLEFMERFRILYRRVDNKKLLELMNNLKESLDNDSIKLDPKTKGSVHDYLEKIESVFNKTEPTDSKILKSINHIFKCEFGNQIGNVSAKESKITALDGNNVIINLIIEDNKISHDKSKRIDEIFPFESSVFIETPLILAYKKSLESRERPDKRSDIYHVQDLINKLETPRIYTKDVNLQISNIINGEVYFDEDTDDFLFEKKIDKNKIRINILNSASGIKSFGILQLLDRAGEFNKDLLLVIDEPEVHLHPDWQVEYAKLLIQLVQKGVISKKGVKVLIASHSPYLIEAINKYSKKADIEENTRFYLSEMQENGRVLITDKTRDKDEIFDKLSKPFERLVFDD